MITFLSAFCIFFLSLIAFTGLYVMFWCASDSKGRLDGGVVLGIVMFLFAAVSAVAIFGWYLKQ